MFNTASSASERVGYSSRAVVHAMEGLTHVVPLQLWIWVMGDGRTLTIVAVIATKLHIAQAAMHCDYHHISLSVQPF